jgi:hypothetical protein
MPVNALVRRPPVHLDRAAHEPSAVEHNQGVAKIESEFVGSRPRWITRTVRPSLVVSSSGMDQSCQADLIAISKMSRLGSETGTQDAPSLERKVSRRR